MLVAGIVPKYCASFTLLPSRTNGTSTAGISLKTADSPTGTMCAEPSKLSSSAQPIAGSRPKTNKLCAFILHTVYTETDELSLLAAPIQLNVCVSLGIFHPRDKK